MGVVSLVLAIFSLSNIVLEIIVSVTTYESFAVGDLGSTSFSLFIGWWTLAIILVCACGIVFAIGGLRQPHRRRSAATIGLCINIALPMALMFLLLVLVSSDKSNVTASMLNSSTEAGSDRSPVLASVATFFAVLIASVLVWRIWTRQRAESESFSPAEPSICCRNCAKQIPLGMKFCRRCGFSLL